VNQTPLPRSPGARPAVGGAVRRQGAVRGRAAARQRQAHRGRRGAGAARRELQRARVAHPDSRPGASSAATRVSPASCARCPGPLSPRQGGGRALPPIATHRHPHDSHTAQAPAPSSHALAPLTCPAPGRCPRLGCQGGGPCACGGGRGWRHGPGAQVRPRRAARVHGWVRRGGLAAHKERAGPQRSAVTAVEGRAQRGAGAGRVDVQPRDVWMLRVAAPVLPAGFGLLMITTLVSYLSHSQVGGTQTRVSLHGGRGRTWSVESAGLPPPTAMANP
jgi:hypothetical protein